MAQEALNGDTPGRFIIDPDRRFTVFGIWEIYPVGPYVPNPDDEVTDWDRGKMRVLSVDYTTGLSLLKEWTLPSSPSEISDEDVFLGVGPGSQSESWRVYLDDRKMPHTLNVDGRTHIYGSAASVIKVFEGTDISVQGVVISAFYDQNNNFLGENIPLEVVTTTDPNNRAVKTPMEGYTSFKLPDGEVVTVVAYTAAGGIVTKAKMLIENTSYVRRTEANRKYVKGIRPLSPWISDADPMVINFPINVTVASIPIQGVVEYSDGTIAILPLTGDDGSQMSLYGLNNYTPTINGQRLPMALRYKLSDDEYAYNQGPTYNGSIMEKVWAMTVPADNAYSVKVYAWPVWRGPVTGYELEFFLYNLDRAEYVLLPKGVVELQAGSRNFDGLDFLSVQHMAISVDLSAVSPKYNSYRHVQTFDVSLKSAGSERRTNWTVAYTPGSDPVYGQGLEAAVTFIDTNQWRVAIDNKFNSKEEWLRHVFYDAQPLYNTKTEPSAPAPDFFYLVTARRSTRFSVEQWNTSLSFFNDLNEGELLYLRWVKSTPSAELELGMTALSVHQVN